MDGRVRSSKITSKTNNIKHSPKTMATDSRSPETKIDNAIAPIHWTAKQLEMLEITSRVFAAQGFGGTDVQLIADQAKVGKGTVYRHFGNKRDLFLTAARYCVQQMGQFIRDRIGDESETVTTVAEIGLLGLLGKIASLFAEFYQLNPHCIEMLILERAEFRESVIPTHLMYRAETRGELDHLIAEAIKSGELKPLQPKDVTNAFADLLFGSVVNGVLEGGQSSIVDRVEKATEMFLHGLQAGSTK